MKILAFSVVLSAALIGCGSDDEASEFSIAGTVIDGATKSPLPGALVSVELDGIYIPNPDKTKGSPSYTMGAQADGSGVFRMKLPDGTHGFHVFADGHRYKPFRVTMHPGELVEQEFRVEPELAMDAQPSVSGVTFEPATAAPGGEVTIRATVAAGAVIDPMQMALAKLSDEVLLVHPESSSSMALDPPAPGCTDGLMPDGNPDPDNPRGCPDGEYSRTFAAPSEKGKHAYFFVVSSEGCVTSDKVQLDLTVE